MTVVSKSSMICGPSTLAANGTKFLIIRYLYYQAGPGVNSKSKENKCASLKTCAY